MRAAPFDRFAIAGHVEIIPIRTHGDVQSLESYWILGGEMALTSSTCKGSGVGVVQRHVLVRWPAAGSLILAPTPTAAAAHEQGRFVLLDGQLCSGQLHRSTSSFQGIGQGEARA